VGNLADTTVTAPDENLPPGEGLIKKMVRLLLRTARLASIMPLTAALRLVFRHGAARPIGIRLRSLDQRLFLRPGTSDVACIEQIFLNDEYALPFALEPKTIVDAGANIGVSVLYFNKQYPAATIIAIEPDVSNFELLTRNCSGLANVICINAALWPQEGVLSIVNPAAEKWALSVEPIAVGGSQDVKAITVPSLLKQFQIDKVDIFKLDIEGAEKELFSVDVEAWLGCIDTIVIELHDRYKEGCARAFYSALRDCNFMQEIRGENIFVRPRRHIAAPQIAAPVVPEMIDLP